MINCLLYGPRRIRRCCTWCESVVSFATDPWTEEVLQPQDGNYFLEPRVELGFWCIVCGLHIDAHNRLLLQLETQSAFTFGAVASRLCLPASLPQVLRNGAPEPAQPRGHGFPAPLKREAGSQRDAAAEKMLQPWGMREAGCLAAGLSRSLRHGVTLVKPPHTCQSHWQVMYVCCLAFQLPAIPRPAWDASSAQWDFYQGCHFNSLSTNPNLTLSWEEFTRSFAHLRGSQESCSLFRPAHLGSCVYTKDASPVVIFPLRRGRWNCLPGIYHSFSSW